MASQRLLEGIDFDEDQISEISLEDGEDLPPSIPTTAFPDAADLPPESVSKDQLKARLTDVVATMKSGKIRRKVLQDLSAFLQKIQESPSTRRAGSGQQRPSAIFCPSCSATKRRWHELQGTKHSSSELRRSSIPPELVRRLLRCVHREPYPQDFLSCMPEHLQIDQEEGCYHHNPPYIALEPGRRRPEKRRPLQECHQLGKEPPEDDTCNINPPPGSVFED
ncbi:Hypothetical predicted protein [Podarcis lilfordi]|uniref:Uncharacterized protein n=1 Tax=Podarcis lilfordi TaxID=74358 RepID=A0AA35KT53_9SAUR|nr:Hypothetical predicted protein [Podarcis lilfordi]